MSQEVTIPLGKDVSRETPEQQQAAFDARVAAAKEDVKLSSVEATIYPDSDKKEDQEPETFMGEARGQLPGTRALPTDKKAAPVDKAAPTEERPEYIPEAQWKGSMKATYEAAASAAYLKQKQAEKAAAAAEKAPEAAATETTPSILPPELVSSVAKEMIELKGKVTPETMAKLKATGIPEELIVEHMEGYSALLDRNELLLAKEFGGDDQVEKMREWVKTLPPSQRNAIEPGFGARSKADVQSAAKMAMALYEKDNGPQSSFTAGYAGNQDQAAPHFKNSLEKSQAFLDPRWYDESKPGSRAYRESVHAMMRESQRLNILI